MPGAEHLSSSSPLVDLLRKQKSEGRIFAAICAAPAVVLARNGLLEGVAAATSYPSFASKMPEGVSRPPGPVVVSGAAITSMGPCTAIDFALQLVASLVGSETASTVAKAMLTEYPPRATHEAHAAHA
jgi:4-methyl-5(b-hydroxyethyl)-thiazole monophosphate biosynthesis